MVDASLATPTGSGNKPFTLGGDDMTRFDWLFVLAFYASGITLLLWGFYTQYSGAGLFGMIAGFLFMLTAAHNVRLDDYR